MMQAVLASRPNGRPMAFRPWRRMHGPGLSLLFGGLCVVFALSGQLVMELRGGADERDTGLDPRHLALFGAMSIVVLIGVHIWRTLRGQANGQRDFHRLLKLRLTELPAGGRGPGFFFTIATTTFGMGLLAHTGERGSSTIHDAVVWLVVALAVTIIAANVARFIARVLPDIIFALCAFLVPIDPHKLLVQRVAEHEPTIALRECWSAPLFSRPPPLPA